PLQAMSPAKLARRYPKAARSEGLSHLQPTQVNHSSESLLLRQADLGLATRSQSVDYALVQVRGDHFGRMARENSHVETIEPAGTQILPRTFGDNRMFPDAILPRLSERSVGDLKHPQRTRGRTIDFKRIPRQLPPPIGARDRIPVALYLSQCGEKFR